MLNPFLKFWTAPRSIENGETYPARYRLCSASDAELTSGTSFSAVVNGGVVVRTF